MPSNLVFDQSERIGDWVAEQVGQTGSWGDFYAMGVERDGALVAGVVFNNYNGRNATAHMAVAKITRLLPLLLAHAAQYAFVHCNLERITALVDTDNKKALRFDSKIGWEEEFLMQRAGQVADLQVFVMWRESCPWLKRELT
jgi:hypothetical protein